MASPPPFTRNDPRYAQMLNGIFQQAVAAHQAGQLDTAAALYNQILSYEKRQFDAMHMLAVIAGQKGNLDEGIRLLIRALNNGESADAYMNLGRMQGESGDNDNAVRNLKKAVALQPGNFLALSNLSAALWQSGAHSDALAAAERAIALNPKASAGPINRGNALFGLRRYDEARQSYETALALARSDIESWIGLGNALNKLKRPEEALAAYDAALAINRNASHAWSGRGGVFYDLGRFDEARDAYREAVRIEPPFVAAWVALADTHFQQQQYEDALHAYDEALKRKPDADYAEGLRLMCKAHLCDWSGWDGERRSVIANLRKKRRALLPLIAVAVANSPADQLLSAKIYAADKFPKAAPLPAVPRPAGERIRVGYLSCDFHAHATAYLTAGLFEQHDATQFETIAFSFGPDDGGEIRQRLVKAFGSFIEIGAMSDAEAAARIRALGVDILVDLKGYTRGTRPQIWLSAPRLFK